VYVKQITPVTRNQFTRDDIYTNDLPCIAVKRAIEAGLLPRVQGWEGLDAEM